jgi:hypothetical protein
MGSPLADFLFSITASNTVRQTEVTLKRTISDLKRFGPNVMHGRLVAGRGERSMNLSFADTACRRPAVTTVRRSENATIGAIRKRAAA